MLLKMELFHSFSWLSNIPFIVYVYIHKYIHRILFIHLFVDWHLGYFCVLTIVNSAIMSIRVHVL